MGYSRLCIGIVAASCLLNPAWADEPAQGTAASLLAAHNQERKKQGRPPLTLSAKLSEAATAHARDMALHHKLDHTGSDGSKTEDRAKRTGYVYVRIGENVARGQMTADEVMSTWMNSPPHRANILADFTEMGAGRVEDDEGDPYWCVDFATPMPKLKPEDAAAAVIKQLNRDREAADKPRLKVEPTLGRAAMAISAAMAANDKLEVQGDPFKLVDGHGIRGRELRIQLSSNVPTPEEAKKSLLGDDPEQLDRFLEIGVGYAVAKSGTPYWCAIFARPPTFQRGPPPKKNRPPQDD